MKLRFSFLLILLFLFNFVYSEEWEGLSILEKITQLDEKKRFLDEELLRYEKKLEKTKNEIEELNNEIKRIEEVLTNLNQSVKKRILVIYKLKKFGTLNYILASSSFKEMFRKYLYIKEIIKQDSIIIEEYKNNLNLLQSHRTTLKSIIPVMENIYAQIKEKEMEILKIGESEENLISNIQENKSLLVKITEELDSMNNNIQNKFDELLASSSSEEEEINFKNLLGKIPLPVKGKIVSKFGKQIHPRFKTVIWNNGIDIEAEEDKPIIAVASGKISLAKEFFGIGKVIIIDHGNRYYTLYSHVKEFLKKEGDYVKEGEIIAKTGWNPIWKNTCHFEIRFKGESVDPMPWFNKNFL